MKKILMIIVSIVLLSWVFYDLGGDSSFVKNIRGNYHGFGKCPNCGVDFPLE